ncbi:MAG: FtsQ-type POTRA domain-containing protein [Chthoniobacter sp.]|nr:FtsQ-type POTRA domain-containing protein [Chthoniobacter sp.]
MKNKRISTKSQREKQHLIEVGIRADKERERRIRAAFRFCGKAICCGALMAGLWFGGREGWRRWVWQNPYFFVGVPEVTTDGTLTREQILGTADIVSGRNILTVDLDKSRAALEKLPQVEHAEVSKTFPRKVAISVTERHPIAWVIAKKGDDPLTSGTSLLIDAQGTVMRSRGYLPQYANLPVISGVETENFVLGKRVNSFAMVAALELVTLNAENTRFQIRHIDLAKSCRLVVTDQRRAQITFGVQKLDAQLARLNQLLEVNEPTHQEIHTVNLIPERYVPVTFYPPEPVTPTPPSDPPPAVVEVNPPKVRMDAKPPKLDGKAKPPKSTPPPARREPARPPKLPTTVKPKPEPAPVVSTPPTPGVGLKKKFTLDE